MVKIEVKQEHIDEGIEKSCMYCPVALAINEVVLNELIVRARFFYITLSRRHYVATPHKVANFMDSFDRGYPVKPFSFELDIPTELLKGSSDEV